MPSARQVSRFTRGSVSALSQRSNCRREILSPVNPERTCRRAPTAGAEQPALARQTISSPWGRARAVPVAPVMYCARSTNNWSAESSSVSSSVRLPLELPTAPTAPTEEDRSVPTTLSSVLAGGNRPPAGRDCCMELLPPPLVGNQERPENKKKITPKGLNRVSPWRLWLSRARGDGSRSGGQSATA